ncbi:MAG: spermidine/putrescine ABC transporter substrate-binding protein [Oligosphaeraceae bacterium]|nr:spermidine/putrescine ABC transporter substrate-binding protein [Oligosphaeraceae bacterium]
MRNFFLAGIFLSAVLLLTSCWKQRQVLHLYCWADYVSPDLIKAFERQFDCRVVYDTFDSNEQMYAKLKAGAGGYDLIVPSHYIVELMVQDKMLMPMDHALLPNLKNLDQSILQMMPDAKCVYSVPYMLSYTGLGYNKQKLPHFQPSWNMLEDESIKGRMTLLDDQVEVIGAALFVLGQDANSVDPAVLEEARKLVMKWRANAAKFENEQYKNGLASGEFHLVMGYSGDVMQAVEENPTELDFVIPEEGSMLSCDVMVIPALAGNPELAHQFINFLHDGQNAADNTEYCYYRCPNQAAYPLLSDEIKNNKSIFVDEKLLEKSVFTREPDAAGKLLRNEIWSKIKAGAE